MTLRSIAPALPLVLFVAVAGSAVAQTPPPGGGMGLPLTAEAVAPWAERVFTRLDADQDDSITGAELAPLADPAVAAQGGSRLRAMISQSDSSRDSRISREELAAGAQRMFARMDRNGDGQLADDELPQRPAPPAPMTMPPTPTSTPDFPNMPGDG